MRRRCLRSSDVGVCPLCRKVVEYGVCCAACGGWFHATESCCGEALADAFLRSGREAWCCLNCAPRNEPPPAAAAAASEKTPAPAALTADLASWRHAFRLLADACGGCGRQIQLARRHVRCAQCDLAFHASEECTGLSAAKVEGACSDASWRCPTCLLHETGCTVPGGVIDEDVAKGKETRPIPIINEVDEEPLDVHLPGRSAITEFEYLPQVAWRHKRAIEQRARVPLADWGGRCIAHEACSWLPATDASRGRPVRREEEKSGGPAYNNERFLLYARDCIFECNSTSGCDESCFNRVVGRGISLPLQVFKTVGRGWGVRSRNPIRAGTFVCEYTGVMLRDEDAEAAGLEVDDSYLFNLDGEEKGQVAKRRKTSHEGPSGVDARTQDNPELCVDASRTGSVARFVNHCCDPNLFVQSVFVEYSRHVHRIALFAARDILAYEELTYDYGYVVGSVQDKTLACLCGAANCRGTLV
mmetsp:Transcript_35340/g.111093  ORF Transcript_35340/g.111093 Transcript_35340/m.111093 type:complete len:473 (-) Transcript_35340:185-1603(-)